MHDAVADVLAQRAALHSGRAAAVVLSIALHAVITGIAVWSALHATMPQSVSTVNIRLASPARPLTPKPPAQAKPKPPAPPRIAEPKPEPIKPTPATTTAPPLKNTAPTSSFGRSTKKASDVPQPPTPAAASTSTAPTVPVGGAGVTGFEGGEFAYPLYVEAMQRKIGTYWIGRPHVAPGVAAVIFLRIERDGTISESKVLTSSGNSTFDRAALSAVRSASPLNSL